MDLCNPTKTGNSLMLGHFQNNKVSKGTDPKALFQTSGLDLMKRHFSTPFAWGRVGRHSGNKEKTFQQRGLVRKMIIIRDWHIGETTDEASGHKNQPIQWRGAEINREMPTKNGTSLQTKMTITTTGNKQEINRRRKYQQVETLYSGFEGGEGPSISMLPPCSAEEFQEAERTLHQTCRGHRKKSPKSTGSCSSFKENSLRKRQDLPTKGHDCWVEKHRWRRGREDCGETVTTRGR